MVEMTEVASILRHATRSSLVMLDEVGRGTATFDGLSLAWAVVEALHDAPRGRAAARWCCSPPTTTSSPIWRSASTASSNASVAVKEWQGNVLFLHRVVAGPSDRSYGIHVAKLAGVPEQVCRRAEEVLRQIERQELKVHRGRGARPRSTSSSSSSRRRRAPCSTGCASADVDRLTPIEALNLLAAPEAGGRAVSAFLRLRRRGARSSTPSERALLEELRPGGVVLFARNVGRPRAARRAGPRAAGAAVAAVRRHRPRGRAREPSRRADRPAARRRRMRRARGSPPCGRSPRPPAAACAHFGIGVDFAPVVDVGRAGRVAGGEARCLGASAAAVVDGGGGLPRRARELRRRRVPQALPRARFAARVDSHRELPLLDDAVAARRGGLPRAAVARPCGDGRARARPRARRRRLPGLAVARGRGPPAPARGRAGHRRRPRDGGARRLRHPAGAGRGGAGGRVRPGPRVQRARRPARRSSRTSRPRPAAIRRWLRRCGFPRRGPRGFGRGELVERRVGERPRAGRAGPRAWREASGEARRGAALGRARLGHRRGVGARRRVRGGGAVRGLRPAPPPRARRRPPGGCGSSGSRTTAW